MAVSMSSADRGQLLAYLDHMTADLERVREHLQVVAAMRGTSLSASTESLLDRIGADIEELFDRVNVAPLTVG